MTRADLSNVASMVETCEQWAKEHFDPVAFRDDDWFTSVDMWADGDFYIVVKHGIGYDQDPYTNELEQIVYDHFEEQAAYVHLTRYPNQTRKEEQHEHEVIK